MTSTAQRRLLDAAGFIAALKELTSADSLRLREKAAYHAPGTGMMGDDLLQEAVRRTLEPDGRNCPADVPVAVYLDNAMRSIADGERDKYARVTVMADPEGDHAAARPATEATPSTEARVLARDELERTVRRLMDMFEDDPQALAVLMGDMEGWSPAETKEVEPMDDTEYGTARRRVRRAIAREFGGGHQT